MKKDKLVININDKNSSKSEIIYDNVVSNMKDMSMNQEEQIQYLKTRISDLEHSQKQRYDFIILGLSLFFALVIGVTFMILNFYFVGVFIIFISSFIGCYHTYKISSNQKKISIEKFEEIDEIRKFISSKINFQSIAKETYSVDNKLKKSENHNYTTKKQDIKISKKSLIPKTQNNKSKRVTPISNDEKKILKSKTLKDTNTNRSSYNKERNTFSSSRYKTNIHSSNKNRVKNKIFNTINININTSNNTVNNTHINENNNSNTVSITNESLSNEIPRSSNKAYSKSKLNESQGKQNQNPFEFMNQPISPMRIEMEKFKEMKKKERKSEGQKVNKEKRKFSKSNKYLQEFNKTDIKIQFVKDGNIVKEGDAAEIYQLAIAELQKKQIRIGSLTSTISELTGKDYTIPNDPFLVLSVNEPYYGAAVILNEVVMNSLYERIGTFYIVPCSIHEVILVPKSIGKLNLEEMRKTVVHVNETEQIGRASCRERV